MHEDIFWIASSTYQCFASTSCNPIGIPIPLLVDSSNFQTAFTCMTQDETTMKHCAVQRKS